MPQNIKYAIQTLTYLWGQASLLFAACVEVNFHRDKFKRHITNYSPNATLDKVVVSGLVNYNLIVFVRFWKSGIMNLILLIFQNLQIGLTS